ncbi:MAG: hypothetical protein QXY45_02610 [Candidatus Aenigmatarchaeota archaeon]
MKGQTLIIEFLLFFIISFSIFALISSFFYKQNDFFKDIVGERLTTNVNNLISSQIIRGVNCKYCDHISIEENVPSKIGGNFYTIEIRKTGINSTVFSGKPFSNVNSILNLNETLAIKESSSNSENKIIQIQINNIKKEVGVE